MAYKDKKSGIYWYDFWKDGIRHRGSTGVRTKRDAEEIEAAVRTNLAKEKVGLKPRTPRSAIPRFDVAMVEFLKWVETEHPNKPATARRYKISSVALLEYFGSIRLDRIDAAAVEEFKDWRKVQKAKPKATKHVKPSPTQRIKPATVNRELACLKKLFYYFKRNRRLLTDNPVSDVKMLTEERTFHVLTHDQEAMYLAECTQPLYDIAVLMIETGMRNDEVYSMKFQHVHLESRYYYNSNGKTPSARRRIPLTDRAISVITRRFEELDGDLIFPGGKGGDSDRPVLKVNNAHYGALKRLKNKLPHFRLYDLRHTFATRFIEAGGDLRTLADILGHKDLRMVMIYSHPTDPHKRRQIQQFEQYNRQRQHEAQNVPVIFPKAVGLDG